MGDREHLERPGVDENMLDISRLVALRSTCRRRQVGCILTDRHNHIIATGYNGVAKGQVHCIDQACPGSEARSGEDLDKCLAIHAEANALLQCRFTQEIVTCYTTTFPCIHCAKLLMNTSCRRIVYIDNYPGGIEIWPYQSISLEQLKSDRYNTSRASAYEFKYR